MNQTDTAARKNREHAENDPRGSRQCRHWLQECGVRRLEPDQKISAHLQDDSKRRTPVPPRFFFFWRTLAQQKYSRKVKPAHHHAAKRNQSGWSWISHKSPRVKLGLVRRSSFRNPAEHISLLVFATKSV
jgi:hypothetical protein